jgi:antitoxin (DNA-binding transcriptional repressor) of toxin-antitoxin stability system
MQKVLHPKVIGIRDLGSSASKIVRRVREKGETVDITYRGQVVARLIPVITPKPNPKTLNAIWADLDQVAQEIGRHWPKGVSAVEAVNEGRR